MRPEFIQSQNPQGRLFFKSFLLYKMMKKSKYNKEDLLDHHGVSAIIKNDERKILMQEHSKFGFWTIPVGKVNLNKDLINGLKGEIFEETNLIVKDCKELIYKIYNYKRNGKNVKVFTHVFEITKYSGELKNKEPEKHKKQEFLNIKEIKQLPYLSDSTLMFLEFLGIKRKAKL